MPGFVWSHPQLPPPFGLELVIFLLGLSDPVSGKRLRVRLSVPCSSPSVLTEEDSEAWREVPQLGSGRAGPALDQQTPESCCPSVAPDMGVMEV